jgi:hypothetical protein
VVGDRWDGREEQVRDREHRQGRGQEQVAQAEALAEAAIDQLGRDDRDHGGDAEEGEALRP